MLTKELQVSDSKQLDSSKLEQIMNIQRDRLALQKAKFGGTAGKQSGQNADQNESQKKDTLK